MEIIISPRKRIKSGKNYLTAKEYLYIPFFFPAAIWWEICIFSPLNGKIKANLWGGCAACAIYSNPIKMLHFNLVIEDFPLNDKINVC